MPIRPERKALYPKNWDEISLHIRARANNCCEMCGVRNGVTGARDKRGDWHDESSIDGLNSGEGASLFGEDYPKMIKIVLTVAHYPDPNPANCSDANLQALCQRCHNRLDIPYRVSNRKITRQKQLEADRAEAGQQALFE